MADVWKKDLTAMRVIAILVLTGLIMLGSLPGIAMAGTGMHGCTSCAGEMTRPDHHASDPGPSCTPCGGLAACAPVAVFSDPLPLGHRDYLRLSHMWPEARHGTTVRLGLNLPPPRV